MKLYATITGGKLVNGQSVPVSKGQGSNEYLDIDIFTTGAEKASHTVEVRDWPEKGTITVDLCANHFGKRRTIAREVIFIGIEEAKGNKQKGKHQREHMRNGVQIFHDESCTECRIANGGK